MFGVSDFIGDWRLAVLAGIICLLAGLMAVCLFHRARGRGRATLHALVVGGILLAATIAAGTGWIIFDLRDRDLAATDRELKNLAFAMAEQTDRAFQALESIEVALIERMQARGIASAADYERQMSGHDIHLLLKDKVGGMPYVGTLTLFSAEGRLFNFSRFWPIPNIDVTDRDFFSVLKFNNKLTSFMGQPVRNRATGTWTIHIARRFSGPSGEFFGLVSGGMEMEYFEQSFAAIAAGTDSSIALVRDDGVLLARHPHLDPATVRSSAQKRTYREIVSQTGKGTQTASLDGEEEHLVYSQKLAHYPFVIMAATPLAVALADWRREADILIGAAILLVLSIGGLVFFGARQLASGAPTQGEPSEAERLAALGQLSLPFPAP